jgi:hypothetical protein
MKKYAEKHGFERGAPPGFQLTPSDSRYLCRSFLFLFVFFVVVNAVASRALMQLQINAGMSSLVRTNDNSYSMLDNWPSRTLGMRWPAPDKMALYSGPTGLVDSVYAVAWSSDRTQYVMDVVRIGAPFNTLEIKKTRITKDGLVIKSNPPIGTDPQLRWRPMGIIINPIIYTAAIWLLIGLIPVAVGATGRHLRYQSWARDELCPECRYDILDLPICPECGTPSHKAGCPDSLS